MTKSPRFSVVIPTRDRAHTLRHALRTCLAQQFDDAEILVSDNGSDSSARGVVESFADRRLKYVHTPRPLAMTDSWEFAVEHATGEFVTVVGDDDGLLLHALPEIDRILRTSGGKVLRWETLYYYWPCLPPQAFASPNRLFVPLRRRRSFHRVRRRSGRARIAAATRWKITYFELPMIYRSMVHRSVLAKLREQTGRVFQSRSPDVYSAFAIAHAAGEFLSVDAPMAISAISGKSNGVANLYLKAQSAVAQEFSRLNDAAAIRRHESAPDLTVMSAVVADSFFHARERLFPADRRLMLDRRKLISRCAKEVGSVDETEWQQAIGKLRASLADDPKLLRWFGGRVGRMKSQEVGRQPPTLKRYGGSYLHLDTSEFGVTNVFEAAELFERLLGYRTDGVDIRLVPKAWERLALIARRLSGQLRASDGISPVGNRAMDGCA